MKDAVNAIVEIVLQGCPFLLMTQSEPGKPETSLAGRILIILAAFLIAGLGAGGATTWSMGQALTRLDERQQQSIRHDLEQETEIRNLKTQLSDLQSERHRWLADRERQFSEIRERLATIEANMRGRR